MISLILFELWLISLMVWTLSAMASPLLAAMLLAVSACCVVLRTGILHQFDAQESIDFAIAASVLKLTISGDVNLVQESEIRGVMKKGGGASLSRNRFLRQFASCLIF